MSYFSLNTYKERLRHCTFRLVGRSLGRFSQVPTVGPSQPLSSHPNCPSPGRARAGGRPCWQVPGHACGWLGGLYHFVGRPGSGVGGRTGRELQAPPFLLHRAALVPPHAVHLLLHAHLDLALAGEHSTLGALLLPWESRALIGAPPPLPASSSALRPEMSLLWEDCL